MLAMSDKRRLAESGCTVRPSYRTRKAIQAISTDLIETDHVTIGRPHFVVTAVVPLPPAGALFAAGLMALFAVGRRPARETPFADRVSLHQRGHISR